MDSNIKDYKKIAYVWDEPKKLIHVPTRLSFQKLQEAELGNFTTLIGRVMAESLDRSDQKDVSELGAQNAASQFIEEAKNGFDYKPKWWHVGINDQGEEVGFLQPVVFNGANRGELEEGTIYYIGVLPEFRGNRYIFDLLSKATRVLQEIGVWRIYCDTDVLNAPMIRAFQEVGYQQHGEPKKITI